MTYALWLFAAYTVSIVDTAIDYVTTNWKTIAVYTGIGVLILSNIAMAHLVLWLFTGIGGIQ